MRGWGGHGGGDAGGHPLPPPLASVSMAGGVWGSGEPSFPLRLLFCRAPRYLRLRQGWRRRSPLSGAALSRPRHSRLLTGGEEQRGRARGAADSGRSSAATQIGVCAATPAAPASPRLCRQTATRQCSLQVLDRQRARGAGETKCRPVAVQGPPPRAAGQTAPCPHSQSGRRRGCPVPSGRQGPPSAAPADPLSPTSLSSPAKQQAADMGHAQAQEHAPPPARPSGPVFRHSRQAHLVSCEGGGHDRDSVSGGGRRRRRQSRGAARTLRAPHRHQTRKAPARPHPRCDPAVRLARGGAARGLPRDRAWRGEPTASLWWGVKREGRQGEGACRRPPRPPSRRPPGRSPHVLCKGKAHVRPGLYSAHPRPHAGILSRQCAPGGPPLRFSC